MKLLYMIFFSRFPDGTDIPMIGRTRRNLEFSLNKRKRWKLLEMDNRDPEMHAQKTGNDCFLWFDSVNEREAGQK